MNETTLKKAVFSKAFQNFAKSIRLPKEQYLQWLRTIIQASASPTQNNKGEGE